MKRIALKRLVFSALCLAAAFVLPFLTGQIPEFGQMLLPMHLPVLLCGLLCGWQWGLGVGALAPLLRSAILGMPPPYPTAIAMAVELATYGMVAGLCVKWLPKKTWSLYVSLIAAMLVGRLVWGGVMTILVGPSGFSFAAFLAGAFLTAWPGILLQLILLPPLTLALRRAGLPPLT